MKVEKLELKHLACYLPYGLKIKCADTGEDLLMNGLSGDSTIEATKIINGEEFARLLAIDKSEDAEEYAIPYLRPLDQLTQGITQGVETFIPIVELANIEGIYCNEPYQLSSKIDKNNRIAHGMMWSVENDEDDRQQAVFGFDVFCGFGLHYRPLKEKDFVGNVQSLWAKLAEWHFDFLPDSLIESGLALPITNDSSQK